MSEHPPPKTVRRTPPGTWPVVVSLGLLIIVAPVTVAVPGLPRVFAIIVAVVFAVAALWALATSFVLLWREWGKDFGVPVIGCVLGAILVTVVLAVMVPLAFGS